MIRSSVDLPVSVEVKRHATRRHAGLRLSGKQGVVRGRWKRSKRGACDSKAHTGAVEPDDADFSARVKRQVHVL
jgi:hypothetical protein